MKRLALLLLLSGCALWPDTPPPSIPTPGWRSAASAESPSADWWQGFGNAELSALLQQALNENHDVRAGIFRIEQARESANIAGASLWPSLDASGSAGRDFSNPARGANTRSGNWRAGFQAAYELDLFGRNRANANAAEADYQATRFDVEALNLATLADTATAFTLLASLNDRLTLADNTLTNAREVLRVTQLRFDAGVLSGLELSQQKAAVAGIEASRASLFQQREQALNQLAVLSARPPQDFRPQEAMLSKLTLPAIAPTQPANMLTRRPDLQALEARLQAANYDIGAAKAAFFPSIGLSASTGLSGGSAMRTLANSIAASFSTPLFDGGAIASALGLAKARRAELEEQYLQAVLTAFQETEDTLAAQTGARTRVEQLQIAKAESEAAYAITRQRFDAGTVDFLTLLDAQSRLFSVEDSLIAAKQAEFAAAIALYRAIGGGWAVENATNPG